METAPPASRWVDHKNHQAGLPFFQPPTQQRNNARLPSGAQRQDLIPFNHHHQGAITFLRLATTSLHRRLSIALRIHSLEFILVHSKISFIQVLLCAPRLLTPSTLPSNNNLCKPPALVKCLKYFNFLRLTDNSSDRFSPTPRSISAFVILYTYGTISILRYIHISTSPNLLKPRLHDATFVEQH